MLEIFQNFEEMAAKLSPKVLGFPGLLAVLLGLLVWLGGLAAKRVLAAFVGALSGGICGFYFIGRDIIPVAICGGVAAIIAMVLEKVIITIIAAALAGTLAFVFLAAPYIDNPQESNPAYQNEISAQSPTMSVDVSKERLKSFALHVVEEIKPVYSQMPIERGAIIAVLVVLFLVGGFFLRRLTFALCFSVTGTMLLFLGMILLLLYKGTSPVSHICDKPLIYAIVFLAMAAFGTIEQLLLCKGAKKIPVIKKQADKVKGKQADKVKGKSERAQNDWRAS